MRDADSENMSVASAPSAYLNPVVKPTGTPPACRSSYCQHSYCQQNFRFRSQSKSRPSNLRRDLFFGELERKKNSIFH
ncbi:unnamed protein product [Ixodes persulcatus]